MCEQLVSKYCQAPQYYTGKGLIRPHGTRPRQNAFGVVRHDAEQVPHLADSGGLQQCLLRHLLLEERANMAAEDNRCLLQRDGDVGFIAAIVQVRALRERLLGLKQTIRCWRVGRRRFRERFPQHL